MQRPVAGHPVLPASEGMMSLHQRRRRFTRPTCVIGTAGGAAERRLSPTDQDAAESSPSAASNAANCASSPAETARSPSGAASWRPGAVPVPVRSPNAAVVRRRAFSSLDMDLEWGAPQPDAAGRGSSAPRQTDPPRGDIMRRGQSLSADSTPAPMTRCLASPTKPKCGGPAANRRVTFNPLVRVRAIPPRLPPAVANAAVEAASVATTNNSAPPAPQKSGLSFVRRNMTNARSKAALSCRVEGECRLESNQQGVLAP
ncbi:hypothetical protein CLOP_g24146 [Closterium sp. NIES-67]|nr:hypothetical protein CLOP_g24146 [Closterium sp. NIES-67]